MLGAALLIAASWPLSHPNPTVGAEHKFRHQFQLFAEQERKAISEQYDLNQLEVSGRNMHREWGRRLAADVVPTWQAAEDRISVTQLPADSQLAPLRAALLEYLDQKRLALNLLSDAARYDDHDKLELGTQVSERNSAKAEQVEALIRQLY